MQSPVMVSPKNIWRDNWLNLARGNGENPAGIEIGVHFI
jgi:hypothetical protein